MSVNLGRVAYVEKGEYKSDTTYESKDVVSFNGGSYVYIGDTPAANVPPTDEAHWQPLIDPTAMNEKIAEMDGVKQEASTAAATASGKAQEATAAAETANTAAQAATEAAEAANTAAEAADEARLAIADELNKKAPAIYVDASGDIVTITDGAEGMPVQSLITHVEPVQEGSGDPSPNNIRNISGWNAASVTGAGKNIFGGETLADRLQSVMSVTRDDEARTISFYANSASGKVFFTDFKPETRYTIILYGRNGSGQTNTYIRYTDGTTGKPLFVESATDCYAVYTTAAGKSVEAFMGSYSSGTTVLYYDRCGIFEGVLTEADFAEYQGQTLTAELPETLYGFDKNWTTGLVTVNWKMVDLGSLTWVMMDNNNHFTTSRAYTSADGRPGGNMMCTHYATSTAATSAIGQNTLPDKSIWANGWAFSATNLVIKDTSYSDAESFTASLAGVKLVFKTNAPYTIQLTPQQMETLKGVNNIWSNAGETTVTYAADTKMYIDNKIAAIAAAIVNE